MKKLTGLFGFGVVGVVLCFVMAIVTAIQENRQKQVPVGYSIPTPAIGQ